MAAFEPNPRYVTNYSRGNTYRSTALSSYSKASAITSEPGCVDEPRDAISEPEGQATEHTGENSTWGEE